MKTNCSPLQQGLDSEEIDRSGVDLGATGRLALMSKLAEGTGMKLPQVRKDLSITLGILSINPRGAKDALYLRVTFCPGKVPIAPLSPFSILCQNSGKLRVHLTYFHKAVVCSPNPFS